MKKFNSSVIKHFNTSIFKKNKTSLNCKLVLYSYNNNLNSTEHKYLQGLRSSNKTINILKTTHKYFCSTNKQNSSKAININHVKIDNQQGETLSLNHRNTKDNIISEIKIYTIWNDFVDIKSINIDFEELQNQENEKLKSLLIPNTHEDFILNDFEIKDKLKDTYNNVSVKELNKMEFVNKFNLCDNNSISEGDKDNNGINGSNGINDNNNLIILCPEEYNFDLSTQAMKLELNNLESTKLCSHKELCITSLKFNPTLTGVNKHYFEFILRKIQANIFTITSQNPLMMNVLSTIEAKNMTVSNQLNSVVIIKKLLIANACDFNIKDGLIKVSSIYGNVVNIISKECDIDFGNTQIKDFKLITQGNKVEINGLECTNGNLSLLVKEVSLYIKKLDGRSFSILFDLDKLDLSKFKLAVDKVYEDSNLKINYINVSDKIDINKINEIELNSLISKSQNKKELNILYYTTDKDSIEIQKRLSKVQIRYLDFFENLKEKFKNRVPEASRRSLLLNN